MHYHFIKERMWQQQITLRSIKTDYQTADLFTNSSITGKFESFLRQHHEVQGMAADEPSRLIRLSNR